LKSHFITARAAARQMVEQHSGVIIFVTGGPARGQVPGATAIGAAFLSSRMNITKEQENEQIAHSNFLRRLATLTDTARVAVLVASDNARMMTGTDVNATAGAALD
jgi:NAD(P)-dependent dehydrogenase (short-subunit alcohol dehydrogenase family)